MAEIKGKRTGKLSEERKKTTSSNNSVTDNSDKKSWKDINFYKFCAYGFLKNLRFFEPFIFLYLLDKDFSLSMIGALFAIKEIAVNILEIPTGIIADLAGRKSSMLFSFLSFGISFALFGFIESFAAWVAVMLLFAMGEGFRTGTHKAIIFDYLERTDQSHLKKVYYSQTRFWAKIGSMFSVIIATVLVLVAREYKPIFWASALMSVLGFLLILTYPNYLNGKVSKEKNVSLITSLKKHLISIYRGMTLKEIKLIGNSALPGGMYKGLKDYIQPLLLPFMSGVILTALLKNIKPENTGFLSRFCNEIIPLWTPNQKEAVLMGVAYLVIYAVAAFGSRASSSLSKSFKSDNFMLNFTLLLIPVLFCASGVAYMFNFPVLVLLGYLIITAVENLRKPVSIAAISSGAKTETLASVLSVESQISSLFAAITVFGAGLLSDMLKSPGKGLMVLAGIMFFVSLLFMGKEPVMGKEPEQNNK